MKDTFYRAAATKQHRIIGNYLAVQAWHRGLDCVVLSRHDLEFFFGLKRFKSTRVHWLKEDLRPWFPHQKDYYHSKASSSIHSLFLSRKPIEDFLPVGAMTSQERLLRMSATAPKAAMFFDKSWLLNRPSEADMLSQLMLLASGVATPGHFTPKEAGRGFTKPNGQTFNAMEVLETFFGPGADMSP